jgi:hypothetical protein
MLSTLKAVVEGDKIHWQEAVENILPGNRPVEVLVTLLDGPGNGLSSAERGKRRIAALQKLAALNSFSEIKDPVKWQQESREERNLPGRES